MKTIHFTSVFLSLVFIVSLQKGFAADSTRLSQLRSMQQSSPTGFINLSIDQFQDLVEVSSKPYSLFVLFSADSQLCAPCGAIKQRVSMIAKEYYSLPASKASSKPVFFAVVRVTMSDQEFLMRYGFRHVPIFYYFAAGNSREYPRQLSDQSPNFFPVQEVGYGQNAIKGFINNRCGSRLRIVRGNYQIPFVETVKHFRPFILLTAAMLAAGIVATGAYKSPMLWFGIVVLIYIFSVGGGHYSWINNTPLAAVNVNGEMEYMTAGSRSQYVAEGFFVSATCVSISILVILIQELPSVIPNKKGQTLTGMFLVMMTCIAITILVALYQVVRRNYELYESRSSPRLIMHILTFLPFT
ncbi:Oligosaccharyl transferase complex subunit OST3/OST6 [Gracilaria domingensis]|nr:Oligosaccharyl transferase complex subunit OST3/OST6 [Gracilaria domingensis]